MAWVRRWINLFFRSLLITTINCNYCYGDFESTTLCKTMRFSRKRYQPTRWQENCHNKRKNFDTHIHKIFLSQLSRGRNRLDWVQNREKSWNVLRYGMSFKWMTLRQMYKEQRKLQNILISLTTEQCKTKPWAFQNSATIQKVSKLPYCLTIT